MDRQKYFDELFDPLYAPLPDSRSYLQRIGLDPIKKADKETLDALVLAHQRSVPFENLDVYDAETELSLSIPALYDKVVTRRRGGYCFELNAAFMALLQSLGYDCYAVAVRVVTNVTRFMPLTHRATIVTIDGVRHFCDVGFGGPSPQSALLLDEESEQQSGSTVFRFDKDENGTVISRIIDGEKENILRFMDTPCDPVDFLALNEYQSKSRYSMFKNSRICNLLTSTGVITLSDRTLKIHCGDIVEEKDLETEDELRAAIKEHFGIEAGFPLKMT